MAHGNKGLARAVFIASLVLTLAGFLITLGGLSALQHKAAALGIEKLLATDPQAGAQLVDLYTTTFTQGGVPPYPHNSGQQFEFEWFILFFELTIFLFNVAIAAIHAPVAVRPISLTFLATAQVLVYITINSLVFFSRNAVAAVAFTKSRIDVTLAGLIIVAVANALTTISLPLLPDNPRSRHVAGDAKGNDADLKVVNDV